MAATRKSRKASGDSSLKETRMLIKQGAGVRRAKTLKVKPQAGNRYVCDSAGVVVRDQNEEKEIIQRFNSLLTQRGLLRATSHTAGRGCPQEMIVNARKIGAFESSLFGKLYRIWYRIIGR